METTNEGEGDNLTRPTTTFDQISEGPHAKDSENNESQFKEDTSQQMLTCKTGNTGTKASAPPCDKGTTTGQGSHGTSPANDNQVQNANPLIQLEARDQTPETDSLERPMEVEVTSSDDSGDWETASEASVTYEQSSDIKGEQNENLDNDEKMETGDHLMIQTPSEHLEKTGSEGTGELAKDGQYCERTYNMDQVLTHGTRPQIDDVASEKSLSDVDKTESQEISPEVDEALKEGTVYKESDPNVKEALTEESKSCLVTRKPPIEEINYEELPKESGPHEQNSSNKEEIYPEDIEAQMEKEANGNIGPQITEQQVGEVECGLTQLHADITVSECGEPLVETPNLEGTDQVSDSNEVIRTELEAYIVEIINDQCSPLMEEVVSDEIVDYDEEEVSDHSVSEEAVSGYSVSEETVSDHSVSKEVVSGHSVSEETVSGLSVSEETVSGLSVSEETVSGHSVSEEAVSGHSVSEEAVSGHSVSEEAVSGNSKSEEAVSGHSKFEEAVSGHSVSKEVVSGHSMIEKSASEMTMSPVYPTEPYIRDTLSGEPGPCVERDCEESVTHDEAWFPEVSEPVGKRTLDALGDSGSLGKGIHTIENINEIKYLAGHTLSVVFEGNYMEEVVEKNENSGYVIDKEQGYLETNASKAGVDSKMEMVNEAEMVENKLTISKSSSVDTKLITEVEFENYISEDISEETSSKVITHDQKELLDRDTDDTVSKDTQGLNGADEETVSTETGSTNEHREGGHEEIVTQVTLGHSAGTIIEETFKDHPESDFKETDIHSNVESSYVREETRAEDILTEDTVHAHVDCRDTSEYETAADDLQTIDYTDNVYETLSVDPRETLSTMEEAMKSDNIEEQNEMETSSILEIVEQGRDSQNMDDVFVDGILIESSREGELAKISANQEMVELFGEISEIPQHIVKERTSKENESEPDDENDGVEELGLQDLKEGIETLRLESESSYLNFSEIDTKGNNLEGSVRISEDLLETISHKRSFENDVDQPVSIIDDILYMNVETDTVTKTDTAEQMTSDQTINKEIEDAELDKSQNNMETDSIPGMLVGPLSLKPLLFSSDPFQSMDLVDKPHGPNTENFQLVGSQHKDITDSGSGELGLPLEQSFSLSFEREDQEPIQNVIQKVEIVGPHDRIQFSGFLEDHKELVEDEPDCFNQALIFDKEPIGSTFLPISIPFTETNKIFMPEATLTVEAESNSPERTLSQEGLTVDDEGQVGSSTEMNRHAVEDTEADRLSLLQGNMDSGIVSGQHAVEETGVNRPSLQITRQRSNTDPCLSYDQGEENRAQQDHQYEKEKSRLRSATPPLDNFTASFTATSPQAVLESRPLEKAQMSIVYPEVDYDITEEKKPEEATPKPDYTFFPTQIFNPLFLVQESTEEHGFYQDKPVSSHVKEKLNKPRFPSPPRETDVLVKVQQPHTISRSRSPTSSKTSMETSANEAAAHQVAPVWLTPRPLDFRPLKPNENPLVRRSTIRHKKNTGAGPAFKRFGAVNLPTIPQGETSTIEKGSMPADTKVHSSSTTGQRTLPRQLKINEEDVGQPKNKSPIERLAEAEENSRKSRRSPEAVQRRGKRPHIQPPQTSETSHSIHRRYSTLINSSSLLYQEYSDVALNQEIQRQKPSGSPAEEKDPGSPRQRRRILSSHDSYLQRLSLSSADSLWQDLPKIRDSVTFMSMSREEQKLQEAKFELIMSEALYLRSLNIAVDHFQRSTELQDVLSTQDRQWLFSRLSEVRDASNDFLFDLEEEFENNMYNFQVCDVVISHEPNFRKVYLPYVTNQSYQDRTFQTLMNNNPKFQHVLAKLESDPVCQRLSLKSFLILPFQRITRLRLLLQNILKRSAPGSHEEQKATEAHNAIEKLIRDCNEGVQKMRDTEELILLHQKIQFECKIFPLISASRRLVKHGEVTSLEFHPISFKWKGTTRQVYLHLFSDCLLLSRLREGGRFVVFDHASEYRVERCEIKLHTNQKNIFRVFLRDSAASQAREGYMEGHAMQYIFRTETQSQKLRWIYALSTNSEQIDFLRDGLTQVQCLKSYKARENDELSLEKADILVVTQNSDEGWLCGIRLSDLQSGWFPQCHVQPISRNACLRNLQEEQRLQNARAKLHPTSAK
ncbi:uncharacterized protein [Pyxicephalus adspersus]